MFPCLLNKIFKKFPPRANFPSVSYTCYNLFTFSGKEPPAAHRCISEVNIMAEILILEMDERLGAQMLEALTGAGHHCRLCRTVAEARRQPESEHKTHVIMNARLPWAESRLFLQQAAQMGWPVLFLTGDGGNRAHLQALYAGVSRVLVSPWTDQKLLEQVDKLIASGRDHLSYGSLRIDLKCRRVYLEGHSLNLTAQEFALLEALMQSPDTALSREHLLRTAWGYQNMGETRTVDVHVQRLRKKLGVERIETVYKLGYRLRMA